MPVTAVLNAGSSQQYTFAGNEGDIVSIYMVATEGDLDTYLILLDPSGNIIIEDDDGYGGTDSLINELELPETGLYTIIATAFDDTTSGNYELAFFIE